ncbi:MAG: ABC transporter ATP-binding protein, partial [Fibrobacter sp.]|nr:ABC transporter ATP-binding protein [Fibrobacter sp.]
MIRVSGISKRFKIFPSPACRLKERIFNRSYHHEYLALSNITFEVNPGETMGIIGENGAGKSTLLKILSGVLLPDTGFVELSGKITGLLELGTGFNYELTGLENVFMNGTFLGMTNEEIEFKKNTIINFAELGVFINEPLKTYSSGMIMRLAFAIAIHADPECFLVDEALSVGDAYFQQKCMRKIQEFKEGGGSIIFVSHDLDAVKVLCDKAIRLKHGKIEKIGSPKEVVDSYINDLLIN